MNRAIAAGCWVALVVVGGAIALVSDTRGQVAVTLAAATGAVIVWFGLWRPRLSVDDSGVTVVNPLRTIHIPWDALVHVDTKYALTLFTPGRKFAVFSAPQPGSMAGNRAVKRMRTERGSNFVLDAGTRVGDLPGTESGDAAALVRERWHGLRDRGELRAGIAETVPVSVRWHWAFAVTVAVGVIATATVPALL